LADNALIDLLIDKIHPAVLGVGDGKERELTEWREKRRCPRS